MLLLILFMMTGCAVVNNLSIDQIVNRTVKSKYKMFNQVSGGFKYYLPKGLMAIKQDENNQIIKSSKYDYYLYVDLVSYYNHINLSYEESSGIYYSKLINGDKLGIINITDLGKDVYYINLKYNYATIQVKVKKKDINEGVANSLIIASSVIYNDEIIANLMKNDEISSAEEVINIFDTNTGETNQLEYQDDIEEDDTYDPDMIVRKEN
jgi:hypothetical protein